jgi:hypothetical protein
MKTIKYLSYILCAMLLVSACKKDDQGNSYLNLRMTDSPGDYSAVNIDLQGIKVTEQSGESYLLNAKPGTYNLVELTNGKDVLIADGLIEGGDLAKITLILGNNNTVILDEQPFTLRTTDAEEGLTIVVNRKLNDGTNTILLDFDVGQSIERTGDDFFLRPVIRVVDVEFTGAIKGRIKPHHAYASITAEGEGGTFTTFTSVGDCDHHNWQGNGYGHHGYHDGNWDGWDDDDDDEGDDDDNGHHHGHNGFFLAGVPPGTYTVTVRGRDPYTTTVILSNVEVSTGEVTNLGKIHL